MCVPQSLSGHSNSFDLEMVKQTLIVLSLTYLYQCLGTSNPRWTLYGLLTAVPQLSFYEPTQVVYDILSGLRVDLSGLADPMVLISTFQ